MNKPKQIKAFSQACENNKRPILSVLQRHLGGVTALLEIGSGTGQHAAFFSEHLPHITWQTSDLPENHLSITSWVNDSDLPNLKLPLGLDVNEAAWPVQKVDGIFSANTCHIMAWSSVVNLFKGIARYLAEGGVCCIYGPFNYQGAYTSESNARFDQWLKQQFPHQGIRNFEAINKLAQAAGLQLLEDNSMPANNRLLVWRKESL